jgi:hypothetical protein
MSWRRFTAQSLTASDRKDSTPRYGRTLLRCKILIQLPARGYERDLADQPAPGEAVPLMPPAEPDEPWLADIDQDAQA